MFICPLGCEIDLVHTKILFVGQADGVNALLGEIKGDKVTRWADEWGQASRDLSEA
jgi:hypothetical protein